MRTAHLMLRQILRPSRRMLSRASTTIEDADVLHKMMPSEKFMKQFVKRPSQRSKLASLFSELDIFLDMFGKDSLPEFDDSIWTTYFKTYSAEERCEFLNDLRLERRRINQPVPVSEREKISDVNKRREENGEIVYAPGFNSIIELRGQQFRRAIDHMYGSRLLSLKRCDDSLPKLIVDCRFLTEFSVAVQSSFARQIQTLHDSNWTSRMPFEIYLANFRPDNHLAEIIKRQWFFHYGPRPTEASFLPHPFAPNLTSKGLAQACGADRSEIMYISWRAKEFLPDIPPSSVRAVVLCASNDFQPWSSSVSAAEKDGIQAYRIPLERYMRFERTSKVLPLSSTAAILRMYFRGESIGSAVHSSVIMPEKSHHSIQKEENELFERYKAIVKEAISEAESSVARSQRPFSGRTNFKDNTKKPKVHRYSREERNRMRQEKISDSIHRL